MYREKQGRSQKFVYARARFKKIEDNMSSLMSNYHILKK